LRREKSLEVTEELRDRSPTLVHGTLREAEKIKNKPGGGGKDKKLRD